ncbi:MAG: YegS/Rv2252/BmrU family lipid kinase [Anaerolineales bacterium]|nr:YegS/Rv2252/BmrU family lipid kinase [Anaerolineales bacterium]
MPRSTLIYNPAAGRFPAAPFVTRAASVLERYGWTIQLLESWDYEQLREQAQSAVDRQDDAVFVAGGDGSVGKVASVLIDTDTALGVLPSGTANVWAKEIGLQHLDWLHRTALEDAAARLARGSYRLIDLGICNNEVFILWAGVGLDGEIVENVEPRNRLEKSLAVPYYAALALWNSLGWQGVDLTFNSEGESLSGTFTVVMSSNIRAYAGGYIQLTPNAKIDDGKLDFWLFEGNSFADVIHHVALMFRGKHIDAEGVYHFQVEEATIEAGRPLPMQFDGEPTTMEAPVKFHVLNQRLRVIVPEGSAQGLFSSGNPTEQALG